MRITIFAPAAKTDESAAAIWGEAFIAGSDRPASPSTSG
jgi:hypothetical protein